MTSEYWLNVMSRISNFEQIDLDASVFISDHVKPEIMANDSDPEPATDQIPPSARLWQRDVAGRSYIGVRANQRPADCTQAAFRLAGAALEREVTPIIITTLSDSGFERFGFRVERILGDSKAERQLQEKELVQFWNIAIVIDITDVASLG